MDHSTMEAFMPHGHCVMWKPDLLALHVGSDLLIFLSYCSIPLAIYYYQKNKPELNAGVIPYLFITFILSCAFTHIFTIWNWWNADYWQSGLVKLFCAIASSTTAIALWYLMPKFLKLPTTTEFEEVVTSTEKLKSENIKLGEESRNKSDMLASVTHEIKNHLNVMVGSSSLLVNNELGEEERDEVNLMMHKNTLILDRLLGDILDISKIDTQNFIILQEEFSLPSLIEQLQSEFATSSAKKDIEFVIDYSPVANIDTVRSDRTRIMQILKNLVSNAIKYTYKGKITLEVRRSHIKDNDCLIDFIVKDEGTGIPKKDQDKIFETFTRSKIHGAIEGVGIGLSVSKKIAELMGGYLELVESSKKGSSFKFSLPVQIVTKRIQDKYLSMNVSPDFSQKKILIADDAPENLRIIELYLRKTNIHIDYAKDGRDALEMLKDNQYDLAILDIEMPYKTGIQVAQNVRALGIDICLVALSARISSENINYLTSAGFDDFIPKPYKYNEIINCLKNLLYE